MALDFEWWVKNRFPALIFLSFEPLAPHLRGAAVIS